MAKQKPRYTSELVIAALKKHRGMVYLAAETLGCSPTTVYKYAKKYKSVQEAIDNERGKFVDRAENKLDDAVEDGQGWAIAFALKTLGKNRGYVEKQQIEQQTVNIDFSQLSDEQIRRLAAGDDILQVLGDGV